jgi:GntR family transcriptional regulator, transcriptional repressor for pyruvate dehydrogenase complex
MSADQQPGKIYRTRIADQILEDLRGQIFSGALPHGTKLPSERQLAAQYGVSGPTIREAIRVLTAMGLVESRNGSGSTVNAQSDTLMAASISSVVQFEKMGPNDVFGLLSLLNAYAVQLAVERATTDDIASLREAAERAAPVEGVRPGADHLRNFHHTLSAISHHPLLATLCRAIVDIQIGLAVDYSGGKPRSWKTVSAELREMRMGIVVALEERDAVCAAELVQAYHQRVVEQMQGSQRGKGNAAGSGPSELLSSWLRTHSHPGD